MAFFSVRRKPHEAAPRVAVGAPASDAREVVGSLAREAWSLGRDAAEVRGLIEDTTTCCRPTAATWAAATSSS